MAFVDVVVSTEKKKLKKHDSAKTSGASGAGWEEY